MVEEWSALLYYKFSHPFCLSNAPTTYITTATNTLPRQNTESRVQHRNEHTPPPHNVILQKQRYKVEKADDTCQGGREGR